MNRIIVDSSAKQNHLVVSHLLVLLGNLEKYDVVFILRPNTPVGASRIGWWDSYVYLDELSEDREDTSSSVSLDESCFSHTCFSESARFPRLS